MLLHSVHAFRILVVEDDADMRALLVEDLSEAGYVIDAAESGLEAANRLKAQPFDLMITDLDMPCMGGNTLLAIISDCFPRMPVITISGIRDGRGAAAVAERRVSGHLSKPFRLHDLRTVIRGVLEAPR